MPITFSLPFSALGAHLTTHLTTPIHHHRFTGHITIADFPDYSPLLTSLYKAVSSQLGSKHKNKRFVPAFPASLMLSYEHPPPEANCPGAIVRYTANLLDWHFPSIDSLAKKQPLFEKQLPPTESELLQFWRFHARESPPTQMYSYYVGMPLVPSALDGLLSCGALADALGGVDLEGITTAYWHVGQAGSGTAFHCEDAHLRSVNLVVAGRKVWVLVDVDEGNTRRFEAFVRRYIRANVARRPEEEDVDSDDGDDMVTDDGEPCVCDQWVRHESLLLDPTALSKVGIRFRVLGQGPGEMVVTAPRQYHAVLNYTTCVAVSVNFLLEGEHPFGGEREVLAACPQCGLVDFDFVGWSQAGRAKAKAKVDAEAEAEAAEANGKEGEDEMRKGKRTPLSDVSVDVAVKDTANHSHNHNRKGKGKNKLTQPPSLSSSSIRLRTRAQTQNRTPIPSRPVKTKKKAMLLRQYKRVSQMSAAAAQVDPKTSSRPKTMTETKAKKQKVLKGKGVKEAGAGKQHVKLDFFERGGGDGDDDGGGEGEDEAQDEQLPAKNKDITEEPPLSLSQAGSEDNRVPEDAGARAPSRNNDDEVEENDDNDFQARRIDIDDDDDAGFLNSGDEEEHGGGSLAPAPAPTSQTSLNQGGGDDGRASASLRVDDFPQPQQPEEDEIGALFELLRRNSGPEEHS